MGEAFAQHFPGAIRYTLSRTFRFKPKDDIFRVPEVAGLLGYLRLTAGTLFAEPRARDIVRHMPATPTLWLTAATLGNPPESRPSSTSSGRRKPYETTTVPGGRSSP